MILRGNALTLPLADDTVDLVVTSPPYFGLRSYQDGGEHYSGQIGDEPTPAEFVDALIAATTEMVRVVKPSGSIWVNLGDKYAGGGGQWDKDERPDPGRRRAVSGKVATGGKSWGHKPKTLMGIPWRYALRCIDDLGLILRAEVIWSKPNGLPESVTDRVRRSHETWFHFTLSPRYYSAVDEIREATQPRPGMVTWDDRKAGLGRSYSPDNGHNAGGAGMAPNPLGKLPGSVWTVATEPLHVPEHVGVDHFAAFPTEWPRRIIQGWSPSGICTACGEGRRPVRGDAWQFTEPRNDMARRALDRAARFGVTADEVKQLAPNGLGGSQSADATRAAGMADLCARLQLAPNKGGGLAGMLAGLVTRERGGEACACPEPTAPTRPATVLDPFGGTGTTALVADALGRNAVHVDMSRDYCRLAQWRTTDPKQRAKAARREYKPPAEQTDGQLDLLEGIA